MFVLDRYIIKEFLKIFSIFFAGLLLLVMMVEFVEKLRKFWGAPWGDITLYFLCRLAPVSSMIIPISVLLSVLIFFRIMGKNNEITALQSGGVSKKRIALPVVSVCAIISLIFLIANLRFIPSMSSKAEYIKEVDIEKKPESVLFNQNLFWFKDAKNKIYNVRMLDTKNSRLLGFTLYVLDGNNTGISEIIKAEEAKFIDGKWFLFSGILRKYGEGGIVNIKSFDKMEYQILKGLDEFKGIETNPEKLDYYKLKDYIARLSKDGYNVNIYEVEKYNKIAMPFITIIISLISASLGMKGGVRTGFAAGIGSGLMISLTFWLLHSISISLGNGGVMPPIVAAWAADMTFAIAGGYLWWRIEY